MRRPMLAGEDLVRHFCAAAIIGHQFQLDSRVNSADHGLPRHARPDCRRALTSHRTECLECGHFGIAIEDRINVLDDI